MTELILKLFVKDYKNTASGKVRENYGAVSGMVGIIVNMILSLVKLALGLIAASMALVADALNNLSDAGASVVSLISFKLSAKPADREHPFGHARIEYISSMIVAFLILIVGFEMFSGSIAVLLGFSEAQITDFSTISIVILSTSILLKLWLSLFYRKIAKKIDSSVIKASSVDSLYDCISTTAVLVSAIVIKFTNFAMLDSIVSLGVSVLIFVAGIRILIETKNSLLGEAPMKNIVDDIQNVISEYPEIIGIHDLMLHNYGPNVYIGSFHVEVDGADDVYMLHDVIDNVERRIKDDLGILCTIHMDPVVTDDEVINELKSFVDRIISTNIGNDISIHDFRAVIGTTHTNLIFDVVLPYESKYSPEKIVEEIQSAISRERDNYYCVITVDRG